MSWLYTAAALAFLLTIVVGLLQLTARSGGSESLLAALLFGTTGVALVLVLGPALGIPRALDVALVVSLLAAVLAVAFVNRGCPRRLPDEKEPP